MLFAHPSHRWVNGMALALAGLVHTTAYSQDGEKLPLWEAGVLATGVSQQAYPGSSQQINRSFVLPIFVYRGQYLRVDQNNVGLRAVKTDAMELDIGFGGALGSSSRDIDARKGLPDLGTLVEFGPRLKWNLGGSEGAGRLRAELALRGVFDVTDSFRDKGYALEPGLTFDSKSTDRWRYSTSLGLVFGDERLAETFYGVAPAYATASRTAYRARGGLIASRLTTSVIHVASPDLQVFAFARVTSVGGAANTDSPLVRQNIGGSMGLGFAYTFARSRFNSTD